MIERYTSAEMGKIWSDENRYQQMLQVELYACEAMKDLGELPPQYYKEICERASFDLNRIYELNATRMHDLVSFITCVNESLTPELEIYFHRGMTATDVVDTALAVQLKQSAELVIGKLELLANEFERLANKYKYTLMVGRTHGMHAEPTTFGFKMALWYDDLQRCTRYMQQAKANIAVGKLSGTVGNFANISPKIEEHVCRRLGLKIDPITNQLMQRDRHALFVSNLAIVGSVLDKIAVEIRNLQRTEIGEVAEPVRKGQAGASDMPHKRNPILCERVIGLSRILRGYVTTAMEDVVLFGESDASHSSVERVILPDACILLDKMLSQMTEIIQGLEVYPEKMKLNLENDLGLIFSQRVFLTLLEKGIPRNQAYKMVRNHAQTCVRDRIDFQYLIMQDNEIMSLLSQEELDNLFDLDYYTKNIDYVYRRLGI